jgi:NAD(P)-dependent dehydrogenase (short-subunit alcohol dehydrogenase family)
MKTIFITGASAGLGKAVVKLFAGKGWKVIATMRQPEKEQELQQLENVTLLPLDVTDEQQIKTAVEKAIAPGEVDIVFNNAGYGLVGPLEAYTAEQIDRQLNTNLLGVISVTKAFIPYFRSRKSGLFITTTSIGGLAAFPFASLYHASKWALEGFSESLAYELKAYGIGVKTVAPGGIATDFGSRSLAVARHSDYDSKFEKMMSQMSQPTVFTLSTPESIAEVVYEAATDGKEQLRYLAGPDANAMYAQRQEQGVEAFRKGIAAALLD